MTKQTELDSLVYPLKGNTGLQRGRKLQRLTFRYKHRPRQACIRIRYDEYSTSITDGPSSGDRGKPRQMDAVSADAFDATVRVAGVVVRDGFGHPLLLTGNAGTTLGVHAGRAQTLQCIHPRCRSDNDLPQRETHRAQRCLQNVVRAGHEPAPQRGRWRSSSQTRHKITGGEMSVHQMKFVVVNNMAPRKASICARCRFRGCRDRAAGSKAISGDLGC